MDHSGVLTASSILLVAFTALSLLCFVLLVVIRSTRDALERRRMRRAELIRAQIFDLIMGQDERVVEAARRSLETPTGRDWAHVEAQIFEMLPKIKGDSRDVLVSLLLAKNTEARAVSLLGSRSAVRRCRGAHELGSLGLVSHLDALVGLLSDRKFLVRRVAVRALGNMGDPRAVRPLLILGEHDHRLARDLVYALGRLGPIGAVELRTVLAERIGTGEHLHLDPAAVVLGLIGDRASIGVLAEGMQSEDPAFAGACAEALGRIGSPDSIPPLIAALLDPRPNVRAAAAHALGSVGSSVSIDSLMDVVDEEESQVSRQAAQAMLGLGPAARSLLESSRSPYAVEALALQEITLARR